MSQDRNGFGGQFLWAMWQPGMLLQFVVLLIFLGMGLWPQTVYPPSEGSARAALPTLQTVAMGQVSYFFLVFPLVMLRRFGRGQVTRPGAQCLGTLVGSILLGLPFYLVAAYLADATSIDGVRTMTLVAMLWPAGWAAGAWMRRPSATAVVMTASLIAMAGLPAMVYVVKEFLPAWPADWLWDFAPATLTWQVAQSRQGLVSGPGWAALAWLAIALAAGAAATVVRSRTTDFAD